MRVAMTAFDGTLILLTSSRETLPLQTQPAPTTSLVAVVSCANLQQRSSLTFELQPSASSAAPAAANQTNQSIVVKPPVAPPPAAPPPSPSAPQSDTAATPFFGAFTTAFCFHFASSRCLSHVAAQQLLTPTLTGYELAVALSASALAIVRRNSQNLN